MDSSEATPSEVQPSRKLCPSDDWTDCGMFSPPSKLELKLNSEPLFETPGVWGIGSFATRSLSQTWVLDGMDGSRTVQYWTVSDFSADWTSVRPSSGQA